MLCLFLIVQSDLTKCYFIPPPPPLPQSMISVKIETNSVGQEKEANGRVFPYQAEFGMVDGVDDWVVDGGGLGQQGGEHGDDGRDCFLVEEQTLPETKKENNVGELQ